MPDLIRAVFSHVQHSIRNNTVDHRHRVVPANHGRTAHVPIRVSVDIKVNQRVLQDLQRTVILFEDQGHAEHTAGVDTPNGAIRALHRAGQKVVVLIIRGRQDLRPDQIRLRDSLLSASLLAIHRYEHNGPVTCHMVSRQRAEHFSRIRKSHMLSTGPDHIDRHQFSRVFNNLLLIRALLT